MGNTFVAEIDIKDFFDTIPLDRMLQIVEEKVSDERVTELVRKYLYCRVDFGGSIINRVRGLIQGNSISPILSNMYLHSLDEYMEGKGYKWLRFADNIYIYVASESEAVQCYNDVAERIREVHRLAVNNSKSGVHDVFSRSILGYEFYLSNGQPDIRKCSYKSAETYHNWHRSVVQKVDKEYHIVQDGILNKMSFCLLKQGQGNAIILRLMRL